MTPSSTPAHQDYASPTVSLAALRARVSLATMALHQTLDEVLGTFDQQLQELHKLRESLRESEKSIHQSAPSVAAMLPLMPALSPMPARDAKPAAEPAPRAMPSKLPAAPLMTQVMWPCLPATPPATPADAKAAARPAEPPLEEATLEELNAALAFAFSQVSNTKPMTQASITQMMPGSMPTSAPRFSNPTEMWGRC